MNPLKWRETPDWKQSLFLLAALSGFCYILSLSGKGNCVMSLTSSLSSSVSLFVSLALSTTFPWWIATWGHRLRGSWQHRPALQQDFWVANTAEIFASWTKGAINWHKWHPLFHCQSTFPLNIPPPLISKCLGWNAIIIIWREKSSVKLILRSKTSKSPTQRGCFASWNNNTIKELCSRLTIKSSSRKEIENQTQKIIDSPHCT